MKNDEIMIQGTIYKKKTFLLINCIVFLVLGFSSWKLVTSQGQWLTWTFFIISVILWVGYFNYDKFKK